MCDSKKYNEIYEEISELTPRDSLQLMIEADSEDKKEFFEMLSNYLLQKKQKEVIAENRF